MNSIHDERRLADCRQVGEAPARRLFPISKRRHLSLRHSGSGHGFPVVFPLQQPIDEGFASRLARFSRSEKDLLQHSIAFEARVLERLRQARFLQVHDVFTSSRSCSDKDQFPKNRRTVQSHLLSDHAAQRESENITSLEPQAIKKSKRVLGHTRHCLRHRSG